MSELVVQGVAQTLHHRCNGILDTSDFLWIAAAPFLFLRAARDRTRMMLAQVPAVLFDCGGEGQANALKCRSECLHGMIK